jgi:hypothetical protein
MGKIELDHTGTGSGIILSSDGTSLLLGGTAIGGLDLYAETYDGTATKPSVSGGTNAVAIGRNSVSSNDRSIAVGSNSQAQALFSAAFGYNSFAYSTGSTAIGAAASASGTYTLAINGSTSSSYSSAIGYNSAGSKATTATGSGAMALGGSYASGADSFAAAITNNTSSYGATGANSVAIGPQAKATGQRSFAATYGVSNNQYSIAFGPCVADQARTFSSGFDAGAYEEGKFARSSGSFNSSSYGQAQYGLLVLRSDTTNATAEALTSNNSAASTTNQIILQNNSAFAFHGTIVARQQAAGGTASAAWKIEGLIRREGSAGTTVLVNSATTVLDNTPSWGMALSADTTNGGLKIEVTGAASTNIRWVATIHTSEVIYA